MKRLFYSLLLSVLFVSCGVSPGDVITLSKDIPGADDRFNAMMITGYYDDGDAKKGTEMYYLGHAFLLEKGKKVRVLYVDSPYCQVSYNKQVYWVHKKFLK